MILDAKYYCPALKENHAWGVPGNPDVGKQILYEKILSEKFVIKLNAFIFPVMGSVAENALYYLLKYCPVKILLL